MYNAPQLERFGTFRQMTQQTSGTGKDVIGDDLVPGIGMDCNSNPNSGVNACRS